MARLTKAQLNEKVTVTCYNETKVYTRKKALDFFREGILCCDPDSSECERYMTIYQQLLAGSVDVSDE